MYTNPGQNLRVADAIPCVTSVRVPEPQGRARLPRSIRPANVSPPSWSWNRELEKAVQVA